MQRHLAAAIDDGKKGQVKERKTLMNSKLQPCAAYVLQKQAKQEANVQGKEKP